MSYQINQLFVSYVYTTNMQAWKKSELKKLIYIKIKTIIFQCFVNFWGCFKEKEKNKSG